MREGRNSLAEAEAETETSEAEQGKATGCLDLSLPGLQLQLPLQLEYHIGMATNDESRRPWGHYDILLDAPDTKVKLIVVQPGKRLSYQRHQRRREHWFIVRGSAVVTLDGREVLLMAGEYLDIPCGSWHRIANRGAVEMAFIEVQTGEYFGEDDIERSEDDFGRA